VREEEGGTSGDGGSRVGIARKSEGFGNHFAGAEGTADSRKDKPWPWAWRARASRSRRFRDVERVEPEAGWVFLSALLEEGHRRQADRLTGSVIHVAGDMNRVPLARYYGWTDDKTIAVYFPRRFRSGWRKTVFRRRIA